MIQSLPYHDPFNVNILPDDDAPVLYCDQAILLPFLCDGGSYVYIATTPGCGREHFAAIAELYREQGARRALAAETRAVPRLDATPAKPRRQRNPRRPSIKTMIEQAEKAAKPLASITLADGTKLDFCQPEPVEPGNPWPLDEFRTKETKQ